MEEMSSFTIPYKNPSSEGIILQSDIKSKVTEIFEIMGFFRGDSLFASGGIGRGWMNLFHLLKSPVNFSLPNLIYY